MRYSLDVVLEIVLRFYLQAFAICFLLTPIATVFSLWTP